MHFANQSLLLHQFSVALIEPVNTVFHSTFIPISSTTLPSRCEGDLAYPTLPTSTAIDFAVKDSFILVK